MAKAECPKCGATLSAGFDCEQRCEHGTLAITDGTGWFAPHPPSVTVVTTGAASSAPPKLRLVR